MFDTQSSKSYISHLHLIMLLLKEPQKYKKSKFFLKIQKHGTKKQTTIYCIDYTIQEAGIGYT